MYSMRRKLGTMYMKKLDKCLNLAMHVTGLGGGGGRKGKYNKKSLFKRIKLYSTGEGKNNNGNLF